MNSPEAWIFQSSGFVATAWVRIISCVGPGDGKGRGPTVRGERGEGRKAASFCGMA